MKSRKESGKRQPSARPKSKTNSGGIRKRIVPFLLLGVVIAVAVGLILFRKTPSGPEPQVDIETEKSERRATDLALRDEAFVVARQLIADFPEDAYPMGLMGTVHNSFGNSAKAEDWWRRGLELCPTCVDAYEVLCVALLRKGEYEKVAGVFRQAQAVDPNLPHVHRRYAEALMEMGELDGALAALEKELTISPGLSENHLVLGKVYLQRAEYEKAVAAYSRALELRPRDSRSYYGLATACARLSQSDKAREYMETFTALRSEEDEAATTRRRAADKPRPATGILAEILVDAGRMYGKNQQSGKAEECWRKAALLDTTNTPCREELVKLYRGSRRAQEALKVCGELQKIDPNNAYYHFFTGLLLADLKRLDAAEEELWNAIDIAPRFIPAYRSLVQVLLMRNEKLSEAHALAEKAVELAPTAQHYALLSQTCLRTQDHPGALAAMKRAAELAPDDDNIRNAYEKLKEGQ